MGMALGLHSQRVAIAEKVRIFGLVAKGGGSFILGGQKKASNTG